jgi:uncharacterized protein YqgC (DUF456 family)
MSKIKFSLIASIVLVLSSFVPVIQVLLLTLNGAFLSLFTNSDSKVILLVNGICSILMFVLFYLSSSLFTKILSLLGVLIFFIPFLFYATEKLISTEKYYFIQFLIIGIITSLFLITIEYITKKATH